MENLIVIIIVGLAAGMLGRHYFKKYKKGDSCSSGCTSCSTDTPTCESPDLGERQIGDIRKHTKS
jgi:hypothetical protein